MPVFLKNVLMTTARSPFSAGTGVTSTGSAHLSGVEAHIDEDKDANFIAQQGTGTLDTFYLAMVASGTDIATGDTITAITLLDGVTPWPADWGASPTEIWQVIGHRERPGMVLPQRQLRIVRAHGGGPAHA